MKISNVNKFRNELYKALEANYVWETEKVGAVWKDGNKYSDMMENIETYKCDEEGNTICVSLAQPMMFRDKGVAITVDDNSVCYWDITKKGQYEMVDFEMWECYSNKMAFVIAVVKKLEKILKK